MTPFDHFQHATVMISEGRRIAARQLLLDAIMAIDRTGQDTHVRSDLVALLEQIGTVWRNADGTWSHPRDAARRWETRDAAETDLRFHQEWARK